MSEPFEEFIAAERRVRVASSVSSALARAEAAALPEQDLAGLDPFQLRDDIAGCVADGQPTTAALLRAMLDRVIAWQATRLQPPRRRGEAER
jgi:hypothetical protein